MRRSFLLLGASGGHVASRPLVSPTVLPRLRTAGRIFRTEDGAAWRWKGVSAFRLLDRFAHGQNIQPFFDAYRGFNLLRVWPYVPWPDGQGWEPPSWQAVVDFLSVCQQAGFYVELTLLSDDDPLRIQPARDLIEFLSMANPPNVVLECGNEPSMRKRIDTQALRTMCEASGLLFSSGDYEGFRWHFGSHLTAHTRRDDEWPRRAHDLLEYHNGGGPHHRTDPAYRVPCVADEPAKPSDISGNKEQDYLAYAGTCALLGSGATWHCESGKYALLPTDEERRCAAAFLKGLNAFPDDAPLGHYRRLDEQGGSLRTYAVGNCAVRIRPTTREAPEPGWRSLDPAGILWTCGT